MQPGPFPVQQYPVVPQLQQVPAQQPPSVPPQYSPEQQAEEPPEDLDEDEEEDVGAAIPVEWELGQGGAEPIPTCARMRFKAKAYIKKALWAATFAIDKLYPTPVS